MMNLKILRLWLVMSLLCLVNSLGHAQRKAAQPHTINPLVNIQTDVERGIRDDLGVFVGVELVFNWLPSHPKSEYKVALKMLQGDRVVYDPQEHLRNPIYFQGFELRQKRNEKYLVGGGLFIAYDRLQLEGGPQTVNLVLSLLSGDTTCTDCISKVVTFTNRKVRYRTVREQEYAIQKLQIDTRAPLPQNDERGMKIDLEILSRYPRIENQHAFYSVGCQLKDSLGRVVYDSNLQPLPKDGGSKLACPVEPGGMAKVSLLMDYRHIKIESPQKLQLVLQLQESEQAGTSIDSVEIPIDPPARYNFKDQKFSGTLVQAVPSDLHGVQGLQVFFETQFAYRGMVRDVQKGPYQFELQVVDADGGELVDFFRIPPLAHNTYKLAFRGNPKESEPVFKGQFFIPYRFMRLPPGTHALEMRLHVSDTLGATYFPVLGSFKLPLTMPEIQQYEVTLMELIVAYKEYDIQFGNVRNIGPDLVYSFLVGKDLAFKGFGSANSFAASPGRFVVWLAKGDKFRCELVDDDTFSKDDFIASWDLPMDNPEKTSEFVVDMAPDITSLKIKFERILSNIPK